jgi:hypothetical protein
LCTGQVRDRLERDDDTSVRHVGDNTSLHQARGDVN